VVLGSDDRIGDVQKRYTGSKTSEEPHVARVGTKLQGVKRSQNVHRLRAMLYDRVLRRNRRGHLGSSSADGNQEIRPDEDVQKTWLIRKRFVTPRVLHAGLRKALGSH
jgi:hypothetical protein